MTLSLGRLEAIPSGEGRTFQIGERRIAVFRSREGGVFATQAECPHRGGPLADGLVGGNVLICPLHSLKFDLTNGQALNGECALRTYQTRLENGEILVELSDAPET